MTTGSRIYDGRYWQTLTTGPARLGTLKSRVWTGTDDPDVKIQRVKRMQVAQGRLAEAKRLRKLNRHAEASKAFGDYAYWRSLPRRRANGPRAQNPYDCTYEYAAENHFATWSAGNGSFRPLSGTTSLLHGGEKFVFNYGSPDLNALNDRLRSRLLGSSFNLPSFLAEGGEALAMIFGTAKVLSRTLKYASRGNFAGVFSELREYGFNASNWDGIIKSRVRRGSTEQAASIYLYWNWGVKPLLSDMIAGAECLAHFVEMPFEHRVKVSIPYWSEAKQYPSPPSKIIGVGTSYARTYLRAYLREVDTRKLIGLDGWGAASAAWELAPYSWLVDYVLPVSSFLEGRGLASALTGRFVYTDVKSGFQEIFGMWKPDSGQGWNNWYASEGHAVTSQKTIKRTISSSLRVPSIEIIPFSEAVTWKRAANVLSVAVLNARQFARRYGS